MIDYTKIERPVEPYACDESPEQWCEVLAWEEARADLLQTRVAELEEQKERIGKAIKKAFPCLAACDERLIVRMDNYNNIVEQFNDTSQQGKE